MNDEKRPLAVEDLLRLKRAERPPAEFWNDFDRQLRAKQLAALVGKRPWWQNVRLNFRGASKVYFPIGATAVFAFTLLSLREGTGHMVKSPVREGPVPTPHRVYGLDSSLEAQPGEGLVTHVQSTSMPNAFSVLAGSGTETNPTPDDTSDSAALTANISPFQAVTTVSANAVSAEQATPSARFIAENLAAAQDAVGSQLLAESHGFEARALPSRTTAVEPLQNMTPPGETRRSARFMAAMVSQTFSDTSLRTAERVASRISVEELYDQPNRFGTRRGGVNMKF